MLELNVFQSQVLYVIIYVVCTFCAFLSQKKDSFSDKINSTKFYIIPFLISFIIPWFVICFTNIGSDYENYSRIIKRLTWDNYATFYSEEAGINIYFLLIRTIAHGNVDISIFLVKTVNIAIVYFSFYLVRNRMKIGYCVLSYLLILYLPSFYLLSIALSFGICILAMSLYLTRKSKFFSFLLIVFAAQLHNSAYLFLISYVVSLLPSVNKMSILAKYCIFGGYVISMIFSTRIYSFAQTISGFHYNNYGENLFSGSGFMVPVLYIPIFAFVYYVFKKTPNLKLKNCFFVFALSSCLFNILSYQFRVIERMEFYYAMLYCLLIPQFLYESNVEFCIQKGRKKITLVGFLIVCYILFRGILVLIERTTTRSGVGHYLFFNPFG